MTTSTTYHALVHTAFHDGTLHPALALALDVAAPDWRAGPAERRWWETHASYITWMDEHDGRHPQSDDDDAAGLHTWLTCQTDSALDGQQRRALQAIPGWSRTAHDRNWDAVRAAIAELTPNDQPCNQVAATVDHATLLIPKPEDRVKLLAYLEFAEKTGRVPESREPGGRWGRRARPADDPVHTFLDMIPTAAYLSATFEARCEEFHALKRTAAGRLVTPTPRARQLLGWGRTQRARARSGLLSPHEEAMLAKAGNVTPR